MHYVLNLTLRDGATMPTYLPNASTTKVPATDNDGNAGLSLLAGGYQSTRYAIFSKFYELTVRIVDTRGQLIALWDGVHHCAPLIRSYIQRRDVGGQGDTYHPNFSFTNSTRTFSKMEIAVIGDPGKDQPVLYAEDTDKVLGRDANEFGEDTVVLHAKYHEYQIPVTCYGEMPFKYVTLPKKGDKYFNGDLNCKQVNGHVVVLNKATKNFTDDSLYAKQYELEQVLANAAHMGYRALFNRYSEHQLRRKGMPPVGTSLDYLDNVQGNNGSYELKTFTITEIKDMDARDFENLLDRIAGYPQDIVEKNLSPADINAIIRRAYAKDKEYKDAKDCPDTKRSPLLERLAKIPSLKDYAEAAIKIAEQNQTKIIHFLSNPYRRVKEQLGQLPVEAPPETRVHTKKDKKSKGDEQKNLIGSGAYRFKTLAPAVAFREALTPVKPDSTDTKEEASKAVEPVKPVRTDTKEEASKQVNIAYARFPRQDYLARLARNPEHYLNGLPLLERLEPAAKKPRLIDQPVTIETIEEEA